MSKFASVNGVDGVFTEKERDYTKLAKMNRYPEGPASKRYKFILKPTPKLHVHLSGETVKPFQEEEIKALFEHFGPCFINLGLGFCLFRFLLRLTNPAVGHGMFQLTYQNAEQATNALAWLHNEKIRAECPMRISFSRIE